MTGGAKDNNSDVKGNNRLLKREIPVNSQEHIELCRGKLQ